MGSEHCKNCEWYDRFDEDEPTGACHRYPPVLARPNMEVEYEKWLHPEVNIVDWCGEWKERKDWKDWTQK